MPKASSETTKTRCRTCNDSLTEQDVRLVLVGMVDRGVRRDPAYIVRTYCPTCVESYYHTAIYSHG